LLLRDDPGVTSLWMVARRLAGTTRGSTMLLIGLVALISGFVEFGVAAARRTDSSFDRFVEWSQPATLSTGGIPDELGPVGDRLPAINSLPGVGDWSRTAAVSAGWVELAPGVRTYAPRLNVAAVQTQQSDPAHDRFKLVAGHVPAADSVHEAITDYPTADKFGLHIGDEFTIVMSEHMDGDDGERIDTPWPVRLVGIVSLSDTFPTIAGFSFATLLLPEGFGQQHPEWIDLWQASERIWLKDGVSGVEQFLSEMNAIGLGQLDIQVNAVNYPGARKVVRLQALGLWLAAGIAAVTGLIVIAQLLTRQRARVAHDLHIGQALGMSRRQALLGTAINDGMRAVAGAVLGTAAAMSLSPLAPFGLARKAEPDSGIWIDLTVAVIGIVATAVAVVGVGALCTLGLLRKSSIRSYADTEAPSRSRVGSILSEPLATGWRMAFSGRRAVVASLTPIVLTVVALVVVATGVHNVVALPHHAELSGGSWDAFINNEDPDETALTEHLLSTTPEVGAWAKGGWSDAIVEGTDVYVQSLEPSTGLRPAITRGRAPVGDTEIALGRAVLEQFGKRVGETVVVDVGDEGEKVTFDIVGEVIVASPLFRSLPPDAGGLISDRADQRWFTDRPEAFLVAFGDGVNPQHGLDAVLAGYPDLGPFSFTRNDRGDVAAIDSMVVVPWILVTFLAVLTIASLAQWAIIASRRERHRAAVLRALGLTGAQVTVAFGFAALLIASASAVIGATIGIAAGRTLWRTMAEWLIVVPQATIPWRLSASALAAMLLTALILAAIAARRHAGSPGPQLRAE
jgi:hypothetical protein